MLALWIFKFRKAIYNLFAGKFSIKILTDTPGFLAPRYMTDGAAGIDLRSASSEPITLAKEIGSKITVPLGFAIELPKGWEAQIRPRSGLAFKEGITVINSPGTIDSDWRGECAVGLVRLVPSEKDFVINFNDRVCQMVLARAPQMKLTQKKRLSATVRDKGGFGSTGLK